MSLDRWECPRCHRALEARAIAESPLHVCTTCGGIAFEKRSEPMLYDPAYRQALLGIADELDRGATVAINGNELKYLHCPRCSGPLARQNFERASGLMVDRCVRHGTWFDQTEVIKAINFLEAGGLEKKARIEASEAEYLYEQKLQMKRIENNTTTFRGYNRELSSDPISRWLGFGDEDFPLRPPKRRKS